MGEELCYHMSVATVELKWSHLATSIRMHEVVAVRACVPNTCNHADTNKFLNIILHIHT